MATNAKVKPPAEEKFSEQDVDLFQILAAIDKKDYGYYSRLTPEQQKKVALFLLVHWTSSVKASPELERYYVMSVDYHANKYLFNENVMKHPKLIWLMLCAASPGNGRQSHQWIPSINNKVSLLQSPANNADAVKYFSKIYPAAGAPDIKEIANEFVRDQKRKCHLAQIYPQMKLADIETLNLVTTDAEIARYEKDRGN